MRQARAALALLLAFALPVRAETTADPLWYLLSTTILAPDARAVSSEGEGPADAKGLAALQADLLVLADGLESFRDEAQAKETLVRLEPRMSPELKPFFRDRASSLDAVYRTLAVTDYTWAQRFPEPPCGPILARRKLLDDRDGLFQTENGVTSPWLVSLLGPQAEGEAVEQALDRASSHAKLTGAAYEKLRARVRKLTLALASDKAVGAARSSLYCSRAAAFTDLSGFHRAKDTALISASQAVVRKPEASVFAVVWKNQRAAAVLLRTKHGSRLITDAAIVAETNDPNLFAFSEKEKPVELKTTVVSRHPELGVAVLTYTGDRARPALALADRAPSKDDLVTAIGHTMVSGLWTKTSGLVTKVGDVSFQTDAAVSSELSGGPVLNEDGEVAGMLVLRRADTEEGRWPVAIPAPLLARWLDDPESFVSTAPPAETIEDAGTAAILSRARPSALIEAGLGAWNIPGLPPPPSVPNGVCMANCGDGESSSSGGSSYSTPYTGPNLWSMLGKLFRSKPKVEPQAVEQPRYDPSPVVVEAPKPPPEPPKPECSVAAVEPPKTVGINPIELKVQFSCTYPEGAKRIYLSGHDVVFSVGWKGDKVITHTVPTDSQGIATVSLAVQSVEGASEKAHDELDKYDPDRKPRADPPAEPAPSIGATHGIGLINAASPGAPSPDSVGISSAAPDASQALTGAAIVLVRNQATKTALIEVGAKITLGAASSAIVVAGMLTTSFVVGWKIGKFALVVNNELNESLDKYNEAIDTRKQVAPKVDPFDELDREAAVTREKEKKLYPRPGDGLDPPGTCDDDKYGELRSEYKRHCSGLVSCKANFECKALRYAREKFRNCQVARFRLMTTCFKGGDSTHRPEYEAALNGQVNCEKLMAKKGCDEND